MQPSRQLNPLQMLKERKASSMVENLSLISAEGSQSVKRTKPSVLKNLSILEGTFPRKFAGSYKQNTLLESMTCYPKDGKSKWLQTS
jgi:hypothetical protein